MDTPFLEKDELRFVPLGDYDFVYALAKSYRFNNLRREDFDEIRKNVIHLWRVDTPVKSLGVIFIIKYTEYYTFDAYEDLRKNVNLKLEASSFILNWFKETYDLPIYSFPYYKNKTGIKACERLGFTVLKDIELFGNTHTLLVKR